MVEDTNFMIITSIYTSITAWFTPIVLFGIMNLIVATIFIANNKTKHNDHQTLNPPNHPNQQQQQQHQQRDSYGRIAVVTSLLERAKSINLNSYIAVITTAVSPPKKATYTSLSRLAQSIYFPSDHGIPSNDAVSPNSKSEQKPPIKARLERGKSVRFSSVETDNTNFTESHQISNSPGQLNRVPSFIDRVKSLKISTPFKSGPSDTGSDPHAIRSKSEKTSVKKTVVEIQKTRSEIWLPSDHEDDDYDSRRPATVREKRVSGDEFVDSKADDFITKFRQQLKLQRVESLVRYNDILQRRTSN